jgi:aquaporin Z
MNDVDDSNNAKYLKYRSKFFISEFFGTALLLLGGLSIVIFMFGSGSPMTQLIPDVKLRQVITGFLFGSIGASIALSPIGKISGAHINPAVTMVFWLFRKIEGRLAITYILAQLTGAIIGCLPLLVWSRMGRSVAFGATLPGQGFSTQTVFLGEVIPRLLWSHFSLYSSVSGEFASLLRSCFHSFMPSWFPWRRPFQAPALILHAVLVRHSFPDSGKDGGSILSVH